MTSHDLNPAARKSRRPAMKRTAAAAAAAFLLTAAALAAAPAASAAGTPPSLAAAEPAAEGSLITLLTAEPPEVTADPGAALNFDREGTTSRPGPEHHLGEVLSGADGTSRAHALALPLTFLVPSSPYGARVSPIDGNPSEFHTGQDFAAPCGSRVLAAAAGTVTYTKWHPGGGGWRVEVTHPRGLKTTYNHLESFASAEGQPVNRGDLIAYSGTTGASTGCHLHFEVWLGGKLTDPAPWL